MPKQFKAWDTKEKKWIEYFAFFPNGVIVEFGNNGNQQINENAILIRFTGLFDKNGAPIYEGDITSDERKIVFDYGMFVPFYDFGRQERIEDVGTDWWSNCSVLGSSLDHPELIK